MNLKNQPQHHTPAIDALSKEMLSFQRRAAEMWLGHEKEAIIALVRVLDSTAIRRTRKVSGSDAQPREEEHFFATMGAASALRPFLAVVEGQPGGVPWQPLHPDVARFASSYLRCCGILAHLRRMATLERYGLASTSFAASGRLQIKVRHSVPELSLLAAMRSLQQKNKEEPSGQRALNNQWRKRTRRMKSYVDVADGWFIRYDNDMEIVSAYQGEAKRYGQAYFEGEALSNDVIVGDRTFGAWKDACDQALGRILCHVDFAALLTQKRPHVSFSDVSTIFARRDDIAAVWIEAGLSQDHLQPTMNALSLEINGLDDWENAYEIPSPFYVDLGKDFLLLPCFGALNNPYFALFRHLRSAYKLDWDRGVDRREAVFRVDLAKLFSPPRFFVPLHGFQLRREDGSKLTDIDAVVLDRETGRLALVQLKWHDVFGRSLNERESRRRNLGKANEWIERVAAWTDGRSSSAVARELGIQGEASDKPPVLYVVARYAARFSGDEHQDNRAAWLAWTELLHAASNDQLKEDPLVQLPEFIASREAALHSLEDMHMEYEFPGLSIDFHISHSL